LLQQHNSFINTRRSFVFEILQSTPP